ncbi:MAG: LysE family transporter [Flavobacteriaceae bacterium]|nr:LysE family transporter [Flavobacteriaceae bacterium]
MTEDILKAIPIGISLAFMIGPVFFMLLHTSIVKGIRAAIVFNLGVVLGDVVFILMAYFGSHQLLERLKDDPNLFLLGGMILFVYGLTMYIKKAVIIVQDEDLVIPEANNYLRLFAKGFLLNFINIGVLAFWLLLLVGFGSNLEMDGNRIFNFFLAILVTYFIIDLGKIFLAKQLQNKLTPPIIYKIKRGMGLLLMFFGLLMLSKGLLPKDLLNVDQLIHLIQ